MEITYRKAVENDLSAINRLMIAGINSTHKESFGDLHPIENWDSNLDFLRKSLDTNGNFLFVAATKETIVGVIFAYEMQRPEVPFFTNERKIYIESLDVDNNFQGHGIGSKLIECVEQIALVNGIKIIELEAYNSNYKANSVYERLGYKIVKVRRKKVLE